MSRRHLAALLAAGSLAALTSTTLAQSTVSNTNKFAWGENIGWVNFRDANGGTQGIRDNRSYLTGFAWGENVGWINFGSTPANGNTFSNTSNTDFGVNVNASGVLSGFAWGENIGWINFGPFASVPNARIDDAAGRLRGFAWGENVGWINLDLASAQQFVSFNCYADCDGSGALSPADFTCFLARYRLGDATANCDRSNPSVLSPADFTCFLARYRAGCP